MSCKLKQCSVCNPPEKDGIYLVTHPRVRRTELCYSKEKGWYSGIWLYKRHFEWKHQEQIK